MPLAFALVGRMIGVCILARVGPLSMSAISGWPRFDFGRSLAEYAATGPRGWPIPA